MEVNINLNGDNLSSFSAARAIRMLAKMVENGIITADAYSVEFEGTFSLDVSFGDDEHTDYWDGEHNHLHVDEEGTIIFRQGPDAPDGTPDHEKMADKGIKIADWAKDHGGITPFAEERE